MEHEPVLYGREAPLARLRGLLHDAVAGRGRIAVISGEAGIGKSSIASVIARDAETRGATVAWGRAWEFADAPPYFPLWPCLRALAIEPQGDAFQLWERVLAALARASSPIVWVVEDLHAADLGTLDLLAFVAQPLRAMRVLVVATTRDRDPGITDRMLQRLSRIARDGSEVRLEPLADLDVAAVAENALGRPVPAGTVRRLVELTGGNPLFVVECARALRLAGTAELAALPPTVRQVVTDRVAQFPDATRDALASGAVLGREFAAATVARIAESLPARIIDVLLPALRAGVVRETRPGHFMFSHTLVRDAIEDALDRTRRAALHGRAEAALAVLGEGAEIVVERARHAIAALEAHGKPDTALALASRAAELLEHERAYDRAFELAARVDAARAAGLLPPADAATKLHAARIARDAGRTDDSRRLCEAVMTEARVAGEPELFARSVLLRLSDIRPGFIDHGQVAWLEEARAMLGDRAPALSCRVQARLASALQPAQDPAVPRAVARDARARAAALDDPATLVDVLAMAGWGIYEAPIAERSEWARELRDRALAAAQLDKALVGYVWLVFDHIAAGDFAAFDRDATNMLEIADDLGEPRHRWRALLVASGRAITAGRFAESDRYITEVEQLAATIDDPALPPALALHRLLGATAARRDDDMRAHGASLDVVLAPQLHGALFASVLRGVCAARAGDADAARRELAAVTAHMPLAVLAEVPLAADDPMPAYLAELVATAGEDDARRVARRLLARVSVETVSGGVISFTYDGPAARVRGLLAESLGELDVAEAALRDALAFARSHGQPPWIAQIAHELARVLRRRGRDPEARALAEESTKLARELDMPGLAGVREPLDAPLSMVRDGAAWRLSRAGSSVTVKDSRGVQLLARLIERPGEEVHVLALASDDAASAPESSAGDMLDDRARKAYRRRLDELADELADAENRNDARRATALERERDALIAELARATGLGGKARAAASATERARVNVQKRLKDAIGRVAELDPDLGRFLERNVRTGTFCCFRP